jgi:chlorobactene glucosyltransferase
MRSLSAANGQWIAFTRSGYDRINGHKTVKNEVVEDVALFRKAKEKKLKVMTLAGTGMVFCRMYANLAQIWSGFTKILFGLTGNNILVFILFLSFMMLAYIYPLAGLILVPASEIFGYLLIIGLLIRVINSWHFRHPWFEALIWHPVSAVFLVVMAVNSFIQARWGRVVWKDRSIVISNGAGA